MADIVGGLFGVTPQSLMQQQQQSINAEANAYAQMDPFQRATAGFYKAGAQIPGAVAGLMGVQDPQLAAATTAQKLAGQFDTSTAEGLKGLSQALLQAGQQTGNPLLANFANITNEKARSVETEQVKLGSLKAQEKTRVTKLAQEDKIREELSKLPEGSTEQDMLNVLRKYGDPDTVLKALERSQTARTTAESKAAEAEKNREFKIQFLELSNNLKSSTDALQRELIQARIDDIRDKQRERNSGVGSLTPAQKALDVAAGKDYADWINKGGESIVQEQLGNLDTAIDALTNKKNITGKAVGLADKLGTLPYVNAEAGTVKDLVGKIVQSDLRAVLGGQFAQKEGEELLKRSYNPALPQEDNLARLKSLRNQISNVAKTKTQSFDYFTSNGTLKDFKPTAPVKTPTDTTTEKQKKTKTLKSGLVVTIED